MLFPDFSFLGEGLRTRCKSTKQMKLLVENPGFILFAVKKKLILQVINRLFMKADINVPIPVLRRMPSYLSFVKTLQKQGEKYVSSTRIAEYMEIDSTQVTKDLSHTGISGKTRVGYEVDSFVRILEDFLGFSRVDGAFLVGAGSLGSALLQDKGLSAFGLQIEAAFDTDKTKIGTKVNDIEIFHIDQEFGLVLRTVCADSGRFFGFWRVDGAFLPCPLLLQKLQAKRKESMYRNISYRSIDGRLPY